MTDQPDDEEPASEIIAYHEDKDFFLQDIVSLANLGLGIGVTLIVEGAMISGTMIGGKKYFEELGKAMSAGTAHGVEDGSDLLSSLGRGFSARANLYEKPDDAADDWQQPEPGYIHLEDAKLYAPGGHPIPSGKGVLFRAKINAVSGFSLGNFTES
jgi:hypothetical protein